VELLAVSLYAFYLTSDIIGIVGKKPALPLIIPHTITKMNENINMNGTIAG
jgi:hypothetical protein